MFKIVTTMLVIAITPRLFAQSTFKPFPDSIRIEAPQLHARIVIEAKNFPQDPRPFQQLGQQIQTLLKTVEQGLTSSAKTQRGKKITVHLPSPQQRIVSKDGDNVSLKEPSRQYISVENKTEQTTFTVIDSTLMEMITPGWEMEILSERYRISVFAFTWDELNQLTQLNFQSLISSIMKHNGMDALGKKSVQARLIVENDQITLHEQSYTYPGDQIFLNGQVAAGIYRSTLFPELTANLGLQFKDRFGKHRYRVFANYSSMFFTARTETGFNTSVNGFLSVGYGRNFSSGAEPSWIQLGAGLLVHRDGNYFEGKTGKFFFSSDLGNPRINLVPEFYFTNDFKKFQPAIKLVYLF